MNKLKANIELAGLSFKKEITIFLLLDLCIIALGVVVFIFFKSPIYLGFILFILVMLDYFYLSRYSGILKLQNDQLINEFISLLPFFKTYLKNTYSIYQAFKELIPFASDSLKERLEKLIENIDEDKSVTPFISFAKTFNSSNIEQLMISIYQMIDEGNDSPYLIQFENTFTKLRNEMYESLIEKRNKDLGNMSVFPLVGSALLIVMISFGVMEVIGGMISGL